MCLSSYQLINSLHESCPILDSKPNLPDEREVEGVSPGVQHACHQTLPPLSVALIFVFDLCAMFSKKELSASRIFVTTAEWYVFRNSCGVILGSSTSRRI